MSRTSNTWKVYPSTHTRRCSVCTQMLISQKTNKKLNCCSIVYYSHRYGNHYFRSPWCGKFNELHWLFLCIVNLHSYKKWKKNKDNMTRLRIVGIPHRIHPSSPLSVSILFNIFGTIVSMADVHVLILLIITLFIIDLYY